MVKTSKHQSSTLPALVEAWWNSHCGSTYLVPYWKSLKIAQILTLPYFKSDGAFFLWHPLIWTLQSQIFFLCCYQSQERKNKTNVQKIWQVTA